MRILIHRHLDTDRRFGLIYQIRIPSTRFFSTDEQYVPIRFKMRQYFLKD